MKSVRLSSGRWLRVSVIVVGVGLSVAACSQKVSPDAPSAARALPDRSGEEVIYGDDNRVDYYDESNAGLKALSESTVALMSKSQISPSASNGMRQLTGTNYGVSLGLCSDERFSEQSTNAFCSGFLIGSQILVTAGHCVPDLQACGETSFVFGYHVSSAGALPTAVSASETYSCAALLHSQSLSDGADYAIVKLDRPVPNHLPLIMRSSGDIKVGDSVTLMGYPEGLPLKIASGAAVRSTATPGFFVANTDSYGGNSGSAVVNTLTHEVEGILVRGEKDFEWSDKGCAHSYKCKDDACRGEDVTRIGEILKTLNSPGLSSAL